MAVLLPISLNIGLFFLQQYINASVVAFLLLVMLSTEAMFFDIYPVLLTAILSAALWDYLYLKPHFEFVVNNSEDLVLLSSFFIIAIFNSILTHKIRKADALIRDKEDKLKTVKLYETLFSSLSHELRTPVTTITGCAESLLKHSKSLKKEEQRDLLTEISAAAFRLNQQINNLLNMSRLESGFLQIKKEWFDIRELIEQVIEVLEYKSAQHTIKLQIPEKFPFVSIDFGLVHQIILNLLNNALQYTPAGSTIIIAAAIENTNLVITVEDDGPGIPESEKGKAFDKFFRGKNSYSGGTGLGLSIVKGFTEAHDGYVSIKNSASGGAAFMIHIPVLLKDIYEAE